MANPVIENFDSYSDGDLNGTNGGTGFSTAWSGNVNYDIQGSVVQAGAKAVTCIGGFTGSIARSFTTGLTAATFECYMRSTASTCDMYFILSDAGTNRIYIRLKSGVIEAYNNSSYQNQGGFSINTWYKITVEIDNVAQAGKFRVKVDAGSFSVWYPVSGGSYTSIDGVNFDHNNTVGTCYWDEFLVTTSASAVSTSKNLLLLGVG